MEDPHPIKLIFIGDSGVGKSCLLHRFVHGNFEIQKPTTDFKFEWVSLIVDGKKVQLQIHDTAGEERYKAITRNYYRKVDGIILVYDVTRMESFISLTSWLNEIRAYCDEEPSVLIVGNKTDAWSDALNPVTLRSIQSFARLHGHTYMETSAMQNVNVENVFFTLLSIILKKQGLLEPDAYPRIRLIKDGESEDMLMQQEKEALCLPSKLSPSRVDNLSKKLFSKKENINLSNSETQTETSKKCC